jgi:hypothetical protein
MWQWWLSELGAALPSRGCVFLRNGSGAGGGEEEGKRRGMGQCGFAVKVVEQEERIGGSRSEFPHPSACPLISLDQAPR